MNRAYVGRLAPSPTGALHLGNVRTFMVAWLRARAQGGKVVFRMEDLDHPRDKPGAAEQAVSDLRWLGFDWDEEFVQSQRREHYRAAIERLHAAGLAYPCVCSRKDVEHAQSAPHAGEQLRYPGVRPVRHLERRRRGASALLALPRGSGNDGGFHGCVRRILRAGRRRDTGRFSAGARRSTIVKEGH